MTTPTPPSGKPARSGKTPLRILLVDDDKDIREVLGLIIEMDGGVVEYAGNYYDALSCMESTKLDLVITDYMMPRMHGLYLLDMIKDKKPDLPVIMITAYWSEDLEAEAKRLGANMLLRKPFEYKVLLDAIRKVL
ncbi:MAG TPA: response regulator [bacterium]|nr:response regulator [bacterium]